MIFKLRYDKIYQLKTPQEYKSEKTLEKMGAMLPPTCRVLREGQLCSILAKYLVPGDLIRYVIY